MMNEKLVYKYYADLGYTEEETEEILMNQGSDAYDEMVDRELEESLK
jgi:hypothetical protein